MSVAELRRVLCVIQAELTAKQVCTYCEAFYQLLVMFVKAC